MLTRAERENRDPTDVLLVGRWRRAEVREQGGKRIPVPVPIPTRCERKKEGREKKEELIYLFILKGRCQQLQGKEESRDGPALAATFARPTALAGWRDIRP